MFLAPLLFACADGTADTSSTATIEGPPIVINEFLARNDTIVADEADEYDDWIEIYNDSDTIVQLDGLYLTDDLEAPTKWALPTGEGIDGYGFQLFWADGQEDQGPYHMGFKLNGGGEPLAIYYVEDGYDPVRLDAIQFESQAPDISAARVPDGSLTWVLGDPTPEASNGS